MRKWTMVLGVAALMVAASGAMQGQSCQGKVSAEIKTVASPENEKVMIPLLKVGNLTKDEMRFDVTFVNFHPARKAVTRLQLDKSGSYSQMLGHSVPGETVSLEIKHGSRAPYIYVHRCVVVAAK